MNLNQKYLNIISIILFIELYSTFFSVYLGIGFIGLLDDLLMITLLIMTINKNIKSRYIQNNLLNRPILIFILLCTFSAIINVVKFDVFLMQLRSYILPAILYFVIVRLNLKKKIVIRFIRLQIFISLPIFISVLVEFIQKNTIIIKQNRFGDDLTFESGFRTFSLMGNPIDYSNFTIIILCIVIAAIIEKFRLINISKITLILFSVILLLTLFMSNSRGAVIAFTFSIFATTFFLNIIPKKKVLVYAFLSFIILINFGDIFMSRLTLLSADTIFNDEYRGLFFKKSFEIVSNNLFFGVGPGMFGGWVSINYSQSYIYEMYNFSTKGISSIDMFFPHLLGELGLFGFVSYLLIYLKPFKYFYKKYKLINVIHIKYFSLINIFLIPIFLIIGWVSIALETQFILSLYFIIVAISENLIKSFKQNN